ncbi:MAG: hypothetical protein AB1Z98_11985 [Nannocystaceae bacterium]
MTGPSATVAVLVARALATTLPSPAAMPPAVHVIVDEGVADAVAVADRVRAEVEHLLEVLPSSAPSLEVVVDGELLDFEVGLREAGRTRWSRCTCTHAELVTHVLRRVAALDRSPVVQAPRPVAADLESTPLPLPPLPPAGLSSRGRLGVAALVIGGVLLGTGAGWMLAPPRGRDELFDVRPGARAFGPVSAAAGGLAIVTAVALLASERRRRRARTPTPR